MDIVVLIKTLSFIWILLSPSFWRLCTYKWYAASISKLKRDPAYIQVKQVLLPIITALSQVFFDKYKTAPHKQKLPLMVVASGHFCEACPDTFFRFVKQNQKLFWMKKQTFHLFNNMVILNLYFVYHENTSEKNYQAVFWPAPGQIFETN